MFLSGQDIVSYLKGLETQDTTIQEVDFEALRAEPAAAPAPAPVAAAAPTAQDARIEGAVQIAIGIKKEVDFAGWYTNVGHFPPPPLDTRWELTWVDDPTL